MIIIPLALIAFSTVMLGLIFSSSNPSLFAIILHCIAICINLITLSNLK